MITTTNIFRYIILSALVVIVFAVANHWVKTEVIVRDDRLDNLNASITTEKNKIMVLEADWAYLASPSRIDRLARALLSYTPIEPERILPLDSISDDDFPPKSTGISPHLKTSDGSTQ